MGSVPESLPRLGRHDTDATLPLRDLFAQVETEFERSTLGLSRWYLVVLATLVGSSDPELCDQVYLYLIGKPEYATAPQRQALVRRMRECLVKCVSLVGVCKPLEAIMAINAHELPADKDHGATREGWQCDAANLDRGMAWMRQLYSHNTESTVGIFADHKDFMWISRNITYGLYLSDRQVLDDLDTQMVVLPAIMIQNLPKETHWHIRGTRRIGVSQPDVQLVWDTVQMIAKHLGVSLHRVPSVADVEHDV